MRVGSVAASIGITATLVGITSWLTGIGTRNRKIKRQAAINMSSNQLNQLSYDTVQITKAAKQFSKATKNN